MEGRVKAAFQLIFDQEKEKCASPQQCCVYSVLQLIHLPKPFVTFCWRNIPQQQPIFPSAVCEPSIAILGSHPIQFSKIDGPFICKTALKMNGAAGPSGIEQGGSPCVLHSEPNWLIFVMLLPL